MRLAEARGKALAKVRRALGRNQHAMARLLEVHPSTLAAWESALRPMPGHRLDSLKVLVTEKREEFKEGVEPMSMLQLIEEVR